MYLPTDINNLTAVNDKTVFLTVVGVVGDIKLRRPDRGREGGGRLLLPDGAGHLAAGDLRGQDARRATTSLPTALRGAIASLDRELPLFDVRTMDERVERALAQPARAGAARARLRRAGARALGGGPLRRPRLPRRPAHAARSAIRLALGSSTRAVFDLVLREGLLLLGVGFAVGRRGRARCCAASLESQLFGVQAADPRVIAGVALLLAGRGARRLRAARAPRHAHRPARGAGGVAPSRGESCHGPQGRNQQARLTPIGRARRATLRPMLALLGLLTILALQALIVGRKATPLVALDRGADRGRARSPASASRPGSSSRRASRTSPRSWRCSCSRSCSSA